MPNPVHVHRVAVTLPTYTPAAPDKNPMFLEKRVYQGSSGKVYPLPFTDRVAETPSPREWQAVYLENDFIAVMLLPELGGRIHAARDKTNGYDMIYRQDVIKPALVGLAGPWISGGIEFNWPQHHRPSTFLPADAEIEHGPDGSVTVWLSEHEPMNRMKGMHGVCLHPDRAVIELKVRIHNRTPHRQTFLWWANVATRVHERYQSFFPPDVTYVADHAKRAMSRFPLAKGLYYGVDYGSRPKKGVPPGEHPPQYRPTGEAAPNDLSWYCNIPVPTSYMCMGTREPFFGGYDHAREAGLIHVANPHISPGKKQWTWGNHPFGYAWDRNLTDATSEGEFPPYIELMAGVYTDNQPDFSFLHPGESRTWSQYWYPIQKIGPAHHANLDVAVSLRLARAQVHLGVAVTRAHPALRVQVLHRGRTLVSLREDLAPGQPLLRTVKLPAGARLTELTVRVETGEGRPLLTYTPPTPRSTDVPPAATEPPAPADVTSVDELYLTGLHLDQYRHATRLPETYWREALRRDAGDSRCHTALGIWHLRRGEFESAEQHLRSAIGRLTFRNPNPASGEAHYHLGLALRARADALRAVTPTAPEIAGLLEEAYAALYKATWNQDWQNPAYYELAKIDALRRDWTSALDHADRALRTNAEHESVQVLKALVRRQLGHAVEADAILASVLTRDPLNAWARHAAGRPWASDTQSRLDVALDYAAAGFLTEALSVLENATGSAVDGTAPLLGYYRAWLHGLLNEPKPQSAELRRAMKASPDYCFPSRIEEVFILSSAMAAAPHDPKAPYYLGNLYYDRRRHEDAIALWERSAKLDLSFSIVWRNLGIAYFNVRNRPKQARLAYEHAVKANPRDARLVYERDQLWKRLGEPVGRRIRALRPLAALIETRDDLSLEWCSLLNQTGAHEEALRILSVRRFQPWEGGEGLAVAQHVRTHLALARRALQSGDPATALNHARAAAESPDNLGEAKHLLANQSDVLLVLGDVLAALGKTAEAQEAWTRASSYQGDFQAMSVRRFSEMTFFSAQALRRLGKKREAQLLFRDLRSHARDLAQQRAVIDYFATSLPTLLLFNDDLQERQILAARFMEAQAAFGLGDFATARRLLEHVLEKEPSHAFAQDLVTQLPAT